MEDLPDILPFRRRLEELSAQMAEPSFYANPRRAAEVTREQQRLMQQIDAQAVAAQKHDPLFQRERVGV